MTEGPILVVEDEARVASFVRKSLEEAGYRVEVASTAADAEILWVQAKPSLVILDLMLPDKNGLSLLSEARANGRQTPVLVLSAKSSMSDRVSGLDQGADDYLGKPFGIQELLARVRVLLRRQTSEGRRSIELDTLSIDPNTRRVSRDGRVIFLSETEYRLLELLAANLPEAVSKKEILNKVWDDPDRDDNVVEVYVSYLRGKLEWGGAKRLIHTVRGRGYMLAESVDET